MSKPRFTEFRKQDGFPLCPRCGDDELASAVMLWWDGTTPRPTMEQVLAGAFFCYYCQHRVPEATR